MYTLPKRLLKIATILLAVITFTGCTPETLGLPHPLEVLKAEEPSATPSAAATESVAESATAVTTAATTEATTEPTPQSEPPQTVDALPTTTFTPEAADSLTPLNPISSPTPVPTATSEPTATPEPTATSEPDPPATGIVLDVQFLETVSTLSISDSSSSFFGANPPVPAHPVNIYRLTVLSQNERGELVDLQADLFVPQLDEAADLPVIGYAPGTTGIGNGCAPSMEFELGRPWGSYRSHMLALAGQGYIVVLPDGQSYDDPVRPHEYFIADLEAYTLLDATRAVYNFLADPEVDELAEPMEAIFFAGYSNGGHSAFAAKDFAASYAPELDVQGVISHGATTNVETLMLEAAIFSPYLIYSYRYYFGSSTITPEEVFVQAVVDGFDQFVINRCVDELYQRYISDPQMMYNPEFLQALRNGQIEERYPVFGTVLSANYAGTYGGFDIPVAFFQGTGDAVVTPDAQERFARDLCAQGQSVTYVEFPAVNHAGIRRSSFRATLAWIDDIVAGETPANDCGDL